MDDSLSQTFSALADPTQRAMLARLSKGDANVSDIAEPFLKKMSLPAVTKHLKVLEKVGLITKTRTAQYRPCKLNGEPLKAISNWVETYRTFWEESFDRLEDYLKTVTAGSKTTTKPKGKKMPTEKKSPTRKSDVKPNELQWIRVYDAPVEAIWDAWTDPAQVAKWWGPRGFTLTTHEKDLRVGGVWHYTMHGPDGTDFPNKTKYFEVEPQKRLVYEHGGNDEQKPMFRVSVDFSESKGKTTMEMTMTLPTAEAAKETKKFIKVAGGNSTWDRLAEYLDEKENGRERFVINRTFDVSIKTMFDVWTQPAHMAKWLPPTGFTVTFIRADIRPGGSSFYVMSDGANKMYGRFDYREIEAPDRIVNTQQFCDESEKVTRHPMSPNWPETMLSTMTLSEESENETRVTIEWEPYGKATAAEIATFVKERAGMTKGWTGSFDKLEDFLATL